MSHSIEREKVDAQVLSEIQERWPADLKLLGVVLFGSRVSDDFSVHSDFDIGILHEGKQPDLSIPDSWDIFFWSRPRWKRGFVLQIELAKASRILYDPEKLLEERFDFIKKNILPHWAGYLRRI